MDTIIKVTENLYVRMKENSQYTLKEQSDLGFRSVYLIPKSDNSSLDAASMIHVFEYYGTGKEILLEEAMNITRNQKIYYCAIHRLEKISVVMFDDKTISILGWLDEDHRATNNDEWSTSQYITLTESDICTVVFFPDENSNRVLVKAFICNVPVTG